MPRHALAAFLTATSLAMAQTTTTVVATDANMVFRQGPLPTSTSNGFPFADLFAAGTASVDQLWSLWWYYRVAGDSMEFSFRNDLANPPTRVVSGPVIVTNWPNVAGRGLFAATLVETVVSTGANRGYVQATMTLTNLTTSPLAIDMFSLSDLEAGGSVVGFSTNVSWGGLRSQYTEQQNSTGPGIEYYCPDADAVQVDVYGPTIVGRLPYVLTNSTVDNLTGWSGTFGPGDHNGAFQWTRVIAPQAAQSFTVYSAITTLRPAQVLYGVPGAGAPGFPQIRTDERAILDPTLATVRGYDVQLVGALPNTIAIFAASLTSALIVTPALGIYVDPATALTYAMVTDSTGGVSSHIGLPPNPALVGISVYHQYFAFDAASPGAFLSWTRGLEQRLGSW